MEEHRRDDGFEVTFVVATPHDEAWRRLRSATPASGGAPPPEPGRRWLPAFEGAADDIEVDEGKRLRARKATFPCEGTEIVVTLEDADTGTRITVAQYGFGPGFDEQRAWLATGWAPIVADLVVFFERGIAPGRHLGPWAAVGGEVQETPSGLVLADVSPGGLADQCGLEPGDLILTVAGSPALTIRDLAVLVRGPLAGGTVAEIRYLRDTRVLTGRGTV